MFSTLGPRSNFTGDHIVKIGDIGKDKELLMIRERCSVADVNIFLQFYDVQKCNSVQIVNSTYIVQKAKSLNYSATASKYQFY